MRADTAVNDALGQRIYDRSVVAYCDPVVNEILHLSHVTIDLSTEHCVLDLTDVWCKSIRVVCMALAGVW